MRPIHSPKTRGDRRYRRHLRVRKRVHGTAERPRLVVFRSLKHIAAQLVDDDRGVTLLGVSDLIVVQTPDAILVCNRHEAEKIKQLVAMVPPELQ